MHVLLADHPFCLLTPCRPIFQELLFATVRTVREVPPCKPRAPSTNFPYIPNIYIYPLCTPNSNTSLPVTLTQ